jgi:chromosome segregation ATPase
VAAAQESEANAWKEAGAAQQARATSSNEAANADGLRKRAEAAWGNEHQARIDAERERDELAARLANEEAALAIARTDLADARAELTDARAQVKAATETERQLRAELSAAKGQIAGLTVERDSVTVRTAELATRVDRAEERADAAEIRAERAEQRADAAEVRIDRDATTVRALQDTLRAALDLPSVEELPDGTGVRVGDSGAVIAKPDALIGVDQVPEVMDGELAARFARAILAVRVHQATHRPVQSEPEPAPEA